MQPLDYPIGAGPALGLVAGATNSYSRAMPAANPEETYQFLSRTYRLVKLVAFASVSIAGVLISLIALDVKVSHWWVDLKLPLYAVVLVALPILLIYTVAVVALGLLLKDALGGLSFYRSRTANLKSIVSALSDLAYNDPITGIPNTNALKQELEREEPKPRCLILLDLQNFGRINKKYNHWVGDEYLRKFAEMVTVSGRRNEFLFKKRPLLEKIDTGKTRAHGDEEVKTFRRNAGGDEFFVLLEGSVVDGLGYLNRLQKRSGEFDQMSREIMGSIHPFGFHAGLVAIAPNEPFELLSSRVSQCLQLAVEEDYPHRVYWIRSEVPDTIGDFQKKIVAESEKVFAKQPRPQPEGERK
jgi:hypothetical protein